MKILVLADGSSSHTERFVNELRAQGVTVLAASCQSGEIVDTLLERNGALEFQVYRNLTKPIQHLITTFKPDIVSAHFATTYGYAAGRTRKTFGDSGARWSLHVWGSDILISPTRSYLHKRRVTKTLAMFDTVFADSTLLAQATQALGAEKTHMVHWGCESDSIASVSEIGERIETFSQRPLKIIAPRAHKPVYRNEHILRELEPLLKNKTVTLTVPESGELFDSFMKQAKRLGVSDSIVSYAHLSRARYLQTLRSHHMYISAAQSDSAPVSLIEAMAVGLVPLVAAHPGVNDLLDKSAREHCCFDAKDGGDLRRKLSKLLEYSTADLDALVLANHDRVLQNAVYENNIAQTLSIFAELRDREDM